MRDIGEINRFLAKNQMALLSDPGALVAQMAFMVRDHDHLRSMLIRCDPAERNSMYQILTPNLRFKPKPLDVYISEGAQMSEHLPVIGEDGKFVEPHPMHEAVSETWQKHVDMAQDAVNEAFAKKRLMLTCGKCTKEAAFTGDTRTDCWFNARLAGWKNERHVDIDQPGVEICPECSRHVETIWPQVHGANQAGNLLITRGWPPEWGIFVRGDVINVEGHQKEVTGEVCSDKMGHAVIPIHPGMWSKDQMLFANGSGIFIEKGAMKNRQGLTAPQLRNDYAVDQAPSQKAAE